MTSPVEEVTPVESRVAEVGGVPMSALVREVRDPRAVLVALHGGAATSPYFHHPGLPRLSLLEAGAALGFTVLALDRPGYGRSAPFAEGMRSPERRVDLAYAAIDLLLGDRPRGAGVFVLAHSAGCELAVRMAADERGHSLLGIELAGTGCRFHPTAQRILGGARPGRPTGLQRLLWEPAELYPAEVIGGAHFAASAPAYESDVVARWAPRDFALTATDVRVPVQYTLGDHDLVWRTDPEAMADIAGLFTAAPRVVVNLQANSGHNLSTGLTAAAYHLRALSFVEECVVARQESRRGTGGG
ncbi:alpha/beta hydrolase [Prauserella sp. PE36]|uniref:alpha/beta hydrolase n=1 Tax=Prauserella sp. PE36 TaxID=1504709 RepID=UPI000DE1A8B4|nr:alpha/beta fold hydrolase [Prauserella sp. PE36]RBM21993.1 alpha/beta hydrolase [Prauserella sp. PE36]